MDLRAAITPQALQKLIYATVDANGMAEATGVHIRLMVTRGLKPTPYQNPNTTIGEPTVVILPEWKEASTAPKEQVRARSDPYFATCLSGVGCRMRAVIDQFPAAARWWLKL